MLNMVKMLKMFSVEDVKDVNDVEDVNDDLHVVDADNDILSLFQFCWEQAGEFYNVQIWNPTTLAAENVMLAWFRPI